ncbi:MAG TPA: gamma-glutamyltransferase [Acidobacteriaceae bacterium]|nr:gamma-glutamyltransferase [Acidobacteriaceae bacterium]
MAAAVEDFERWGALPVYSRRAMVASADELSTNVGLGVLREGGSVIDAAVSAAFALSVTQPGMCGLGGGGHLLARFADGEMLCLDFREQAPGVLGRDSFVGLPEAAGKAGWLAAAVPGTVKGLAEAHRRAGRLDWARLVTPAIKLAAEGHPVSYLRSQMLAGSAVLAKDPESYRTLLRNGNHYEAGEILRQPELAKTLERIARDGPEEFYQGETAERFARAAAESGGVISKSDLAAYTCAEPEPLMRPYKGWDVWTMPPSSAGGIGLLQILGILEGTTFAQDGPLSSLFLHYCAEAMRRAFADRAVIGDPAFVQNPAELLGAEHLERLRKSIHPDRATPSSDLGGGAAVQESPCTTHVSILDCDGNSVALTFTVAGRYGSGVTVPGLGFLLNNNMGNFAVRPGKPNRYGVVEGEANTIAAGKRPVSSMAPTLLCRGTRVEGVLGTPGGPTIVSAMAQALLCLIEFDWNPQDAVNALRIHQQWMPDVVYLERGFPADVTRALEARGHRLEYKPSLTDMNAIIWRDGWLQAGTDRRRDGFAAGV